MKKNPKIIAHCLIKNEQNFIWYALKSVLPFVDKIMVWDTGSTDKTISIIKSIKSKKIHFKQLKPVTSKQFPQVRQQMLDQTPKNYTWIMILDGDEVWPARSIKKAVNFCKKNPQYESLVVRSNNLIGDIYHRLPERAGKYNLAGRKGHLSIRFINRKTIPGLKAQGEHGVQGYFDKNNNLIQERDPSGIKFLNIYYHHATHLQRTAKQAGNNVPKRSFKYKYSPGLKILKNQIPKIFFTAHPEIVPDVTMKAPIVFWLKSALLLPVKLIKNLFIFNKIGY